MEVGRRGGIKGKTRGEKGSVIAEREKGAERRKERGVHRRE